MNREIKFRAWDEKHKQFNYFDLLGYFNDHAYYELGVKNVCQYTGLKDKNGKSIYEDDILLLYRDGGVHVYDLDDPAPEYRIVNFNGDEAGFTLLYVNREMQGSGLIFCKRNADNGCFEVIGNIYQNPELLETEK